MKEHPIIMSTPMVIALLEGKKTQTRRVITSRNSFIGKDGGWGEFPAAGKADGWKANRAYPRWDVGARLWVKEAYHSYNDPDAPQRDDGKDNNICYKADWGKPNPLLFRWTPSIFMPRWASRILLEIVKVRVERIQEITLQDMWAEGMDTPTQFELLWDSLNAKRGYGWSKNPWVWVLEFRKVKK